MLNVIPNPKKTITVDYPAHEVKEALQRVPWLTTRLALGEVNTVLNKYPFVAMHSMIKGITIEVYVESLSETKTKLKIEGTDISSLTITRTSDRDSNIANQNIASATYYNINVLMDEFEELFTKAISLNAEEFRLLQTAVRQKTSEILESGRPMVDGVVASKNWRRNRALLVLVVILILAALAFHKEILGYFGVEL